MKMKIEKVFELIKEEVGYAQYWDKNRLIDERAGTFDKDKDVETWLAWMLVDIQKALQHAYTSTDKTKALVQVRKIAGLAVSCMMHNETPARGQDININEREGVTN